MHSSLVQKQVFQERSGRMISYALSPRGSPCSSPPREHSPLRSPSPPSPSARWHSARPSPPPSPPPGPGVGVGEWCPGGGGDIRTLT